MKKSSRELISEFYKLIKEDYPHLTERQVKDVCFAPWEFLKETMQDGELNDMRFKFFGNFAVKEGRAISRLRDLKKRFLNKEVEAVLYFKYKKQLEDYIKKHDYGKRFQDKIWE